MSNFVYKGYKGKWDMYIYGDKKRINSNGHIQILDYKTRKWVTVDYLKGDRNVSSKSN